MLFPLYQSISLRISLRSIVILFCMTFVNKIYSEDKIKIEDFALCRNCGYDVASARSFINLQSPIATTRVNLSLFGIDEVYVQTLVNPLGIHFKVVTVLESSCTTSGQDWSKQHSWFPGYAWKPCKCSRCKRFLGWVFEPLEHKNSEKILASDKGFYALVLENLISELYSNQLLVTPTTLSVR